ncbi:hypothetical protein M409DRAFT_31136 [Zasmidium cellare ATCC 36951]|uniref:Uncharacterized protein n=1 Tax=Zasmidium cellare ATCC 36951 TaxID=1080233 RepID=A0A6A6BU53_ZASCE|nr:uncharacterized protein M409DRAFT_31136 [Zasmidium cellare ATCC 36951]KAF2158334.1 hypothetical protein M409DRAFT_31136 [Zasmidium cellare ATCC 36951]
MSLVSMLIAASLDAAGSLVMVITMFDILNHYRSTHGLERFLWVSLSTQIAGLLALGVGTASQFAPSSLLDQVGQTSCTIVVALAPVSRAARWEHVFTSMPIIPSPRSLAKMLYCIMFRFPTIAAVVVFIGTPVCCAAILELPNDPRWALATLLLLIMDFTGVACSLMFTKSMQDPDHQPDERISVHGEPRNRWNRRRVTLAACSHGRHNGMGNSALAPATIMASEGRADGMPYSGGFTVDIEGFRTNGQMHAAK